VGKWPLAAKMGKFEGGSQICSRRYQGCLEKDDSLGSWKEFRKGWSLGASGGTNFILGAELGFWRGGNHSIRGRESAGGGKTLITGGPGQHCLMNGKNN